MLDSVAVDEMLDAETLEAKGIISEYSDDGSIDYPSEGTEDEFEEVASEDLKAGKVSVQNKSGNLWCPFCAGKKKSEFKYADLLQHAKGVSKGKRGAEAAGAHKALVKYLQQNMSHMAEPSKERLLHLEQETPERMVTEEKLVWPWMGILVNIDNSKLSNGKRVGPGNGEIKSRFARFHPKSVHTLWNFHGHQGVAVVEFDKDMIGYGDAQDFERSFLESRRGKRDWERSSTLADGAGKELYGWVANQQDYYNNDAVGKHMRDKGNLKTVAEVNEMWSRQKDQLLQSLDATIQDKNQKLKDSNRQVIGLQAMVVETENARQRAEMQRMWMEEVHKQELRAVEQEAKRIIQMREEVIKKEREQLDAEFQKLQTRCQDLEKQEVHNEIERTNREKEMSENEKKLQHFYQIQELHKEQEAKKMMLIKKQEGESNSLLVDQHRQQKMLLNLHKLEQEIQALEATLESRKLAASGSSNLKELEEKLEELKEEKEDLQDMNQLLSCKERELNDEVQNARKVAVKVLDKKGDVRSIAVKKMGELTDEPWLAALKPKYKNDPDALAIAVKTAVSKWDEQLRDSQWYPFKVLQVGGKPEQRIDEQDENLASLRKEYGEAVMLSVVKALEELHDHNASGRYPVPVAWNYKEQRKATLEEIIMFLATEKAAPRKRRRNI